MTINWQFSDSDLAMVDTKNVEWKTAEAQKKAEWLTEQNLYDLHGTDLHRTEMLDKILQANLPECQLKRINN